MTIEETRVLAEKGDADAQFNLALYYQYGRGVEQNSKTFIPACPQAEADSPTPHYPYRGQNFIIVLCFRQDRRSESFRPSCSDGCSSLPPREKTIDRSQSPHWSKARCHPLQMP